MTAVIEANGLVKRFGKVLALDGLDLTVEAGEVHGYLGPNGAGKSTTIRILLGLARASDGAVSVFGKDPWREASALHRRIATIPGDVALWPNLSGGETIDLLVRLRGGDTKAREYTDARAQLIDAFQFDPTKKARSYSKGNRQKVALIAALAHPAELYIFDEPTSGLDPLMEAVFTQHVRRIADAGGTVLLSSHILSEVEKLCTRVSILRAGRIVESGALGELRHLAGASPDGSPVSLEELFLRQYRAGDDGDGHRSGSVSDGAGDAAGADADAATSTDAATTAAADGAVDTGRHAR